MNVLKIFSFFVLSHPQTEFASAVTGWRRESQQIRQMHSVSFSLPSADLSSPTIREGSEGEGAEKGELGWRFSESVEAHTQNRTKRIGRRLGRPRLSKKIREVSYCLPFGLSIADARLDLESEIRQLKSECPSSSKLCPARRSCVS